MMVLEGDTTQHMDIISLVNNMTLEEKAGLCSGKDFWNLKGVERLGVPSVMITDGPHGLRKQGTESDHVGVNRSLPATCFPTASAVASSWDTELAERIGTALGDEARQEKVAVILGPGANIKRSPLCGRNFEYYSEDPFLTGKMVAASIKGIQSRGIGTSLKHFVANNQEKRRMTINAVIDERALREIYLAGFEEAVKNSQPDTVMCAYNRLNGEYCSENSFLLTQILKDEWRHKGLVVTDWGAANDRVKGLKAGLELEMPGNCGLNDRKIVEAVQAGNLRMEVLDRAVERLLQVILKNSETLKTDFRYDIKAHHELARKAAASSAVLLKNNGILPLDPVKSVAVLGKFAEKPRYQGSGSSLIYPTGVDEVINSLKGYLSAGTKLIYADGYNLENDATDSSLIEEAVKAAEKSEIVLIFAGLTENSESEGFDRLHLEMPSSHNDLIKAVTSVNSETVVILSNGAPVAMPWINEAAAVLESYLGGQAWGSAVADLLYGREIPSGKLAETFPRSIEEDPAAPNFPGGSASVIYAESIYVGYRYYDRTNLEETVLFPFGYGLSYSTFKYSDLEIESFQDDETFLVTFNIKNNGPFDAQETAQVYVKDPESSVFRPEKELKGFSKIKLKNGETGNVSIELNRRAFSFWDSGQHKWIVEPGDFEIMVGASSADIRLQTFVNVKSDDTISTWAAGLRELIPEYYHPEKSVFSNLTSTGSFRKLLGHDIPLVDIPPGTPFDSNSSINDIRRTIVGKLLYKIMLSGVGKMLGKEADVRMVRMMEAIVKEMPLRGMLMMSGGKITDRTVDALVTMINGRFFKGIGQLIRASGKSCKRKSEKNN